MSVIAILHKVGKRFKNSSILPKTNKAVPGLIMWCSVCRKNIRGKQKQKYKMNVNINNHSIANCSVYYCDSWKSRDEANPIN